MSSHSSNNSNADMEVINAEDLEDSPKSQDAENVTDEVVGHEHCSTSSLPPPTSQQSPPVWHGVAQVSQHRR